MRDALKPFLQCDEELYNIELCVNLGQLLAVTLALF